MYHGEVIDDAADAEDAGEAGTMRIEELLYGNTGRRREILQRAYQKEARGTSLWALPDIEE